MNIAAILKDCPKGTKLYSPAFGDVELESVRLGHDTIIIKTNHNEYCLRYNGKFNNDGEVMIFPSKENRDWSTFQRPFKDGDILATEIGSVFILNTDKNTDLYYGCYVGLAHDEDFLNVNDIFASRQVCHFASEEEKQKLFDAIKENGYKWNTETKTLEELIEPKFDITTLKTFESKVLVRSDNFNIWKPAIFGFFNGKGAYMVGGIYWSQVIPYEGNEHLLGTTDDCDEYYKNW